MLSDLRSVSSRILTSSGTPSVPRFPGTSFLNPITVGYLNLPGVSLSGAEIASLEADVAAVMAGETVTKAGFTAGLSLCSGDVDPLAGSFMSNPSVDVRWTALGGFKLTFTDTAAKVAVAYGRGLGIAEAFTAETATGWVNRVDLPFDTFTAPAKDIVSAINLGADTAQCITNGAMSVLNGLYIVTTDLTMTSGTTPWWMSSSANYLVTGTDVALAVATIGAGSFYVNHKTEAETGILLMAGNFATNFALTISIKRVTRPSQDGITLVNAAGAYNFQSIQAGFNPDDTLSLAITRV